MPTRADPYTYFAPRSAGVPPAVLFFVGAAFFAYGCFRLFGLGSSSAVVTIAAAVGWVFSAMIAAVLVVCGLLQLSLIVSPVPDVRLDAAGVWLRKQFRDVALVRWKDIASVSVHDDDVWVKTTKGKVSSIDCASLHAGARQVADLIHSLQTSHAPFPMVPLVYYTPWINRVWPLFFAGAKALIGISACIAVVVLIGLEGLAYRRDILNVVVTFPLMAWLAWMGCQGLASTIRSIRLHKPALQIDAAGLTFEDPDLAGGVRHVSWQLVDWAEVKTTTGWHHYSKSLDIYFKPYGAASFSVWDLPVSLESALKQFEQFHETYRTE